MPYSSQTKNKARIPAIALERLFRAEAKSEAQIRAEAAQMRAQLDTLTSAMDRIPRIILQWFTTKMLILKYVNLFSGNPW